MLPPPTFRACSGISAVTSASGSDIECFAPKGSTSSALHACRSVLRCLAVSALSRQCPHRADRSSTFLWPRLTSAGSSARLPAYLASRHTRQSSQGKTRDFPPIHPPHLRQHPPDDIGLGVFWPSRPGCRRLNCSSFPRTGSLPAASFGFRLAANTLAVQLEVPVIKALAGTFIRHVTSRIAFAPRLQTSMTLRAMPDTPRKTTQGSFCPAGYLSMPDSAQSPGAADSFRLRTLSVELCPSADQALLNVGLQQIGRAHV